MIIHSQIDVTIWELLTKVYRPLKNIINEKKKNCKSLIKNLTHLKCIACTLF